MNTETKQQKTMETKTKKQIMKFLFKHMDKKTRDEYKDSLYYYYYYTTIIQVMYYHAFDIKMFFRSLPFALLCQELFKRAAEDTLDVSHDLVAFQIPARFVESDVLVLQHGGDNCTAVLPFVQNLV